MEPQIEAALELGYARQNLLDVLRNRSLQDSTPGLAVAPATSSKTPQLFEESHE